MAGLGRRMGGWVRSAGGPAKRALLSFLCPPWITLLPNTTRLAIEKNALSSLTMLSTALQGISNHGGPNHECVCDGIKKYYLNYPLLQAM